MAEYLSAYTGEQIDAAINKIGTLETNVSSLMNVPATNKSYYKFGPLAIQLIDITLNPDTVTVNEFPTHFDNACIFVGVQGQQIPGENIGYGSTLGLQAQTMGGDRNKTHYRVYMWNGHGKDETPVVSLACRVIAIGY